MAGKAEPLARKRKECIGGRGRHAPALARSSRPRRTWAAPIEARFTSDQATGKTLGLKIVYRAGRFVQAGKDEPERPVKPPRQPGGQHLGAADSHRVKELADGDRLRGDHEANRVCADYGLVLNSSLRHIRLASYGHFINPGEKHELLTSTERLARQPGSDPLRLPRRRAVRPRLPPLRQMSSNRSSVRSQP